MCRLDESEQQDCTRRGPHENHNDEESYIDLSLVTDRCVITFGFEDEKK
jgi:hypothetical protein